MNTSDVTELRGLKVGDQVTLYADDGFLEGVAQPKTIQRIAVTEWSTDEQRELIVPQHESLFVFTDGTCAGHYARVVKRHQLPVTS